MGAGMGTETEKGYSALLNDFLKNKNHAGKVTC